ncbi:acyl-CoA dehydrogenase family protein [Sporichthya sp.]|uniref:acyl-CoA dehydrogenase family protein n=1 Tax=Sporichthya sp. TaxID=65475 RepID=UPI0017945B35|nr:acyl-CoA dehydrogenase family protein [Sporichthya sp.]MBA3741967.1 acyl-CoA/acyl-ACP dehydrogenase [Sporichthya sp.]
MSAPKRVLFGELPAGEAQALAEVTRSIALDLGDGRAPTKLVRALGESGLLGFGIPEDRGGSGGTVGLAALVAEELGAAMAAPPVLHQLVGVHLLSQLENADLLGPTLTGESLVLSVFGAGDAVEVPFAATWDLAVLCSQRGTRLLDRGCLSAPVDTWIAPDWRNVRAEVPEAGGASNRQAWDELTSLAGTLGAAYSLGSARALLTETARYVGVREQFGAPVGSFQAVKHPLANAWIDLRHARELVLAGLAGADDSAATDLRLGALAAGSAAQRCAEQCLQAMGGIGFTWESDVHRHLKAIAALRHWPVPELRARAALRAELLDSTPP